MCTGEILPTPMSEHQFGIMCHIKTEKPYTPGNRRKSACSLNMLMSHKTTQNLTERYDAEKQPPSLFFKGNHITKQEKKPVHVTCNWPIIYNILSHPVKAWKEGKQLLPSFSHKVLM